MLEKKNSLIIFFGVVVLILAGAFYLQKLRDAALEEKSTIAKQEVAASEQTWSVIYLTSGDIYLARLDYPVDLSDMRISSESYMVQVAQKKGEGGEVQSNVQLTPLEDFLWAPNKLYINRDQVVFYGPVKEESAAGQAIKEAGKWNGAAEEVEE
jgi:hypothetical protein